MDTVSFSLIVCTRERPVLLERTLRGVRQLRYPRFEVIVIRDPADMATAECLARLASGMRIGDCAAAHVAQARNLGLTMARGEIVAFLDDDAVPEPDWLDELARGYAQSKVAAVGGFIRDPHGVGFQRRVTVIDAFGVDADRPLVPGHLAPGQFLSLTGTNFSVRRAMALNLGGFDEHYAYYLEETDFLRRVQQAGGRVCVRSGAEVHHGFAASAQRDEDGVPRALYHIGRSKTYYCAVNRRDDMPAALVAAKLRRFARGMRRKLFWGRLTGRLDRVDAKRVAAELRRGMAEGSELACHGRRLLDPSSAPAPGPFEPYAAPCGAKEFQRRCVLTRGVAKEGVRALADTGDEVTVFCVGQGWRHSVAFVDGLWLHRLPLWWCMIHGGERLAVRAELRRIAPRRCFTHIGVAKADAALARVAGYITPELPGVPR